MQPTESRFAPELTHAAVRHLEALGAASAGVALAVLTSEDGFEIAAYRAQAASSRIAAMSSSLQALSEALVREAGLSGTRSLIIEAQNGTVLVLGIESTAPRVSLAIVASSDETLGQLLWNARNCCKALEQTLQT